MPLWRGGPNTRTLPTVLLTPSASKAADTAHLYVPQNQALGVCRGFVPNIQICGTHGRKDLVNTTIILNAEEEGTLSDSRHQWADQPCVSILYITGRDSKFDLQLPSQCGPTITGRDNSSDLQPPSQSGPTITGRDNKFDMQLLSQSGPTFNCLSRSGSEKYFACCWGFATKKQKPNYPDPPLLYSTGLDVLCAEPEHGCCTFIDTNLPTPDISDSIV